MVGLEVDNGVSLVDLLEVERSGDGGCGLVEVMSDVPLARDCSLCAVC